MLRIVNLEHFQLSCFRGLLVALMFSVGATSSGVGLGGASLGVEFDFPQAVEIREVMLPQQTELSSSRNVIEVVLPISVRFHGQDQHAVEEITIEVNASAAGLQVYDFSPTTQLASELTKEIETTTTTERARSLDATLGGVLPVPYANLAAHIAPSISGGISNRELAIEKASRLPPKHVLVVSGTSHQGQGVFFKLKRNSQSTLEGVHELVVSFLVPDSWHGDAVSITCTASGQRRVLWIQQPKTWGRAKARIELKRRVAG